MNDKLFGVLEFINHEGGTISQFNPYVIMGTIYGIPYRYFISEGWIGLKVPEECPAGKSLAFESKDEFIEFCRELLANLKK